VTVAEQCEQRIMNIREEEKQGIVLLVVVPDMTYNVFSGTLNHTQSILLVAMYVFSLCEIYRKKVAYCLHHCYEV